MASIYFYPVGIRIWHLINLILYLLLIGTGISMQYSSQDFMLIRFDYAVSIHNISGIILSANYIYFILFNIFTKNGRYYRIQIKGYFTRMMKQARYYIYGMFVGEKAPYPLNENRKFNPLQKIAYVVVMYIFMPILIITGWALIFPEMIFANRIFGTSGLHLTDLFHILAGFVGSLFMFVHLYLCTIGKPAGTNFKAMISGWHEANH